jgi:hypothetical protein
MFLLPLQVTLCPTPSSVWTWPVATWLTTWWRSWLNAVTASPPLVHTFFQIDKSLNHRKIIKHPQIFYQLQLSEKSFVTSRRSCATSPWTLNRKWPPLLPPPPWRSPTSCPTVRYKENPFILIHFQPLVVLNRSRFSFSSLTCWNL